MPEDSATAVLKRYAPGWFWLRQNFKLPAVVAIGGLVLSSGAWIYTQRIDIQTLKKRDPTMQLDRMEGELSQILQQQAAMRADLVNQGERIAREEAKWDHVEEAAEIRVPRRRH